MVDGGTKEKAQHAARERVRLSDLVRCMSFGNRALITPERFDILNTS